MDPTKPLVLVVDADTNVRKAITAQLQAAQYEVVEARNGREGLDLTTRFRPDLLLIDGTAPLIDGFKVCQYVKADPQLRGSKVVVLTGNEHDIKSAVEAGADDCVAKPVGRADIAEKVRRILGGGGGPNGAEGDSMLRREYRKPVSTATVSWGSKKNDTFEVMYKERVIDISPRGLSFEHVRCEVCTGYEKDTVHPQCPFYSNSKRAQNGSALPFVIHLPDNKVLEVHGRIAHVFQPPDWPRAEKVGVVFTEISKTAAKAIREFLQTAQTVRRSR